MDRKKKKDRLLPPGSEEENGVTNPMMDEEAGEGVGPSGGESSAETIDEAMEADALVKDLKTKHRRKQKELSKVKSPKDDLAQEMKTIKKKSREAVEEAERQEEEEATMEVAEDGTVPMIPDTLDGAPSGEAVVTFREPEEEPEEEAKPEEEVETVKKLKKKKIEEEVQPFPADEIPDTAREEAPPEPPTPKEETKTPRGKSLRDKMKSRLAKAKEEAATELQEQERTERRLKREQKTTTRFEFEVTDEKLDERRAKMKDRWKKKLLPDREKKKAELKEKGVFMPSSEEAFDFFTRDFEPEPEPVKEKAEEEPKEKEEKKEGEEEEEKKEGEEEEKKEGEEGEEEEEKAKKKKDEELPEDEQPLLDDVDEEGAGMFAIRRAEFDDTPEAEKKRDDMLFVPSVFGAPAQEKVGEQKEPRFLEDEGFYVGTRPNLGGWNLNKMENRLLKQGAMDWFGEDGRMLALPNPLRPNPSRPQVPEEPEPFLETVYCKAVVREYDNRYIDGSMDNAGFYQLDVDINAITFSHHHLFSREHVLAERLTLLFEQYVARKNKNMTEFLTEKLKALKSSALHLREHMVVHKSEHSYSDRSNYERRLQDYKYEIRKTRALRDREEESDRKLLKNIIKTWKALKTQRETQKFNNSAAKLQIHKEEVDKIHDQAQWKLEIEEELEEMKEEYEEEYEQRKLNYEHQMKEVKKQREAKEEARKRQKRKGSKGSQKSKLSAEQEQDLAEEDKKILEEEDLPEPDPAVEFDAEASKVQIKEKVMANRRRPGEPKLYPELTHTASITPTNQCPRGEQQRREDVSKCKIYIKVMFNNKEVSRTPSKVLSQDFKVNFGQIYNLKIVQWPEIITFQIHETLGFGSEMLAELCMGIPEVSVTSQSVQLENMEFSSDHKVHHSHEGVGSGLPFTYTQAGDLMTLMTTGEISSSVAWAVDEYGTPLVPPVTGTSANVTDVMKKMDPMAAIGATGVTDIQKLSKWFEESRLDPNDPANADLVYMLRPKGGDIQLNPPDYFRLEQLQEEFNFCDDMEMANNKRYQLLELRDGEVADFKNYKMVPIVEKEIPRDTFTEYEKKKREEEKMKQSEDIEEYRAEITRYLQKIRESVMRKFRQLQHHKSLPDVVLEEDVPNIAMIGANLLKATERRRPLRPERKERKKVTAQAIKDNDLKILVSVTRALYVPTRLPSTGHGGMTAREETKTQKSILGEPRVQPFVEVMFQHNTVRTSTGDGPNPSFNEELTLPFRAPNGDYSPSSLQTVDDNVYLNLFDEVLVDMVQRGDRYVDRSLDDRQSQTVHQRIERKWLGRMCVPFSTIYYNGKIEGTFQIKAPPILLGYTGDEDVEGEVKTSSEGKTYMSMFITMEPPVSPPEPMKEKFVTNESEKLLQYADEWQTNLNSTFPKREYKTTVVDINGKSVFVTRYFKALKPPEELIKGDTLETAKLLARYVSLIPHVSDAVVFPGLCDIWSRCDEFLRMNVGDEEEHAVLLTNFFLGIGKKSWLIIGTGIPEGATAYVMTEEGAANWIWNANTGQHYSVYDNFCPLIAIGCVINDENIYANVQQYEKPAQMNFDFNNTSHWMPFYSRRFPNQQLGSIQPESLYYFTAKKNVGELQEKLEQHLKNKIMEWRSRFITRWNRHCTQIMRRVLPVLEENLGKSPGASHLQDLEHTFSSYKVSGFPLNMPFTEISTITEEVFSTGVHAQESSDVEFALAVYMHSYPNNVLSVWVYVASLIRHR